MNEENNEKIIEKTVGVEVNSNGKLNHNEYCKIRDDGNNTTSFYTIWIPMDICDQMRNQAHNGLMLGLAMALLLRMQWSD